MREGQMSRENQLTDGDADKEADKSVKAWLSEEGYPLEFAVANACRAAGFAVNQGDYVRGDSGKPREVDILAFDHKHEKYKDHSILVRLYNVIECKWSKKKPWIVLTSKFGNITSPALIAQTISSEAGQTACWFNSGNSKLIELETFSQRERIGFSGRQSFTDKTDYFYNSINSVTSLSMDLAKSYNKYRNLDMLACVCFPVIVVDGLLYEAFQDSPNDDLTLNRIDNARCLWRGVEGHEFRVPVDIVTRDSLDAFLKKRRNDASVIIDSLLVTMKQMVDAKKSNNIKDIKIWGASTGMIGMPPFLRKILMPNKT
jgi:hypothetical protein